MLLLTHPRQLVFQWQKMLPQIVPPVVNYKLRITRQILDGFKRHRLSGLNENYSLMLSSIWSHAKVHCCSPGKEKRFELAGVRVIGAGLNVKPGILIINSYWFFQYFSSFIHTHNLDTIKTLVTICHFRVRKFSPLTRLSAKHFLWQWNLFAWE